MGDNSNNERRVLKKIKKSRATETPQLETQPSEALPSDPPPVATETATATATVKPESLDPFDPAALRLNPNTASGAIGVKRKLVTLKCGKPDKMEFCRVHPDPVYRIDTAIIEDKVNHETYLVAPALWPELPDFISLVRLCTAVNRHGTPFLWQAKLPDPNGRPMDWHTSMLEAQELAVKSWVRVQADMSAGSYAVFEATGNLPEPEWPDLSLRELLELTFKTRFIDSLNHAFLQELFGAA
ncbi:hypothetical protein [Novipirellula artificiosorum]|uniref:Uncharacterized protein n=1 Tax=Novipirellula artificiosorum TaxID=2528016 RepID=A0A5C6D864_9BACT|nr:hypothetical protein [Novipirellula artificiosorum]TWU32285.1 hypothetical protein Poly41_57710 [Novipirellula artificiosorum]